jgi:uncharacterized NAD(P)/FAD-binding protein YdhS
MARSESWRPLESAASNHAPASVSSRVSARTRSRNSRPGKVPRIIIIGGGFSGAAVAYHLLGASRATDLTVTIVEPRRFLGAGLAYSTEDAAHRINVPADRMSLDPEDALQFRRWLESSHAFAPDPEGVTSDGRAFPHRHMFGRYVKAQIEPWLVNGRLHHVRGRAVGMGRAGKRYLLQLSDGRCLVADLIILAVCHPPPALPRAFRDELGNASLIQDPWRPGALATIRADARVLIVGTGLTMADVVASLDACQHHGLIFAFSRRGLRSRGHALFSQLPAGDFSSHPAITALELLQRVRKEIAKAQRSGFSWHAVVDALRAQGSRVWAALPLAERRRLIRHLRPYWDAHRFRIAPQTEAVLEKRMANGSLQIAAASLLSAERNDEYIDVTLRCRYSGKVINQQFDTLVMATGPDHSALLHTEPLLRSMAELGLLQVDPTGLGLRVDRTGRAVDERGDVIGTLFIAGPLGRGTFGELMGVPEVARYAVLIAGEVVEWIKRQSGSLIDPKTDAA